MKITNFRGAITDVSARKGALWATVSAVVSADTSVTSPSKMFILII